MSACCQDCLWFFLGEEEGTWWCKCGEFYLPGVGDGAAAVNCPDYASRPAGVSAPIRRGAKSGAAALMEAERQLGLF